jgi:hypothetical protein
VAARLFNVRTIQKTGGSVLVTLPKDICEVMNFRPSDRVYVYIVGGVVCLRKMDEGGFSAGVVAVSPPPGIDIEVG